MDRFVGLISCSGAQISISGNFLWMTTTEPITCQVNINLGVVINLGVEMRKGGLFFPRSLIDETLITLCKNNNIIY